jgi:hypothetical protein
MSAQLPEDGKRPPTDQHKFVFYYCLVAFFKGDVFPFLPRPRNFFIYINYLLVKIHDYGLAGLAHAAAAGDLLELVSPANQKLH